MSFNTSDSNHQLDQSATQSIKKLSSSLNGNKRQLKQFSVKNHNNSVTSFKTNFNKNNKHNSLHDLTDYCNSNNHSPKSVNSATSFNKSKSSEDINRRKRNNSKSMFNAKLNARQLSKSLSRNSTQSRNSKQSLPNTSAEIKSSSSNPSKDSNTLGKADMTTGLNKTFDLQSDSDYEDLEENHNLGIIQLENQTTDQTDQTEKTIENKVEKTDLINTPELSSHSTRNTHMDDSDVTSESTEYKNLLNSNSQLLAIDKDSLYQDKNKLSYLVPSSFRTNSRVSADRISSDVLLKVGSQNYTDLLSSGMMEEVFDDVNNKNIASDNNRNESYDNNEDKEFDGYNAALTNKRTESSDFIDNTNLTRYKLSSHEDDQIINPSMMLQQNEYQEGLEPQFEKVESKEDMAPLATQKNIKYNSSSSKLKNDRANTMEYSSFSSSFMNDKDSDHKFNYINTDFINSSTSTEIKKYFSANEKSTTTENPSDLSDNSQMSNQNATIKEEFGLLNNNEVPLIAKNESTNSSNSTIHTINEQNRLNKLKQASRDQKFNQNTNLQTRNSSMTNLYTNLVNNRSPITTPERNVFKNNLLSGRNLNNLETSNARPNTTGSLQRNPNTNNFNSNSMAANSLLKIATMANSNGSPVANQKSSDTDFNDFNSFLKSDSLNEDKDSRTQQRLWLQRENSILDLSTDQSRSKFDAIFQPFSVDAKRDFEKITKEYNNIKRFGNPLVESLKKIQSSLEINVDNKTASESKLTISDRTGKTSSNMTSLTNLNTNKTQSVKSYSTSAGQDTNKMNMKNNETNPYDSILANIWDTEAKKMINFNQNFFQDNTSNPNQSSFLMRHNSSNGYFRNSPRTMNSASSYR